jgi:hypothetical protein
MPIAGPPTPPTTPFIVAEISKNWEGGKAVKDTPLIAQQFETVINFNAQRGYRLHSFQLHRFYIAPGRLNETLIAVFSRVTPPEPT